LKFKLVLDNTGNVPVVNPAWSDPGFDLTNCPLPATFTPEASPAECIFPGTWAAGQRDNLASASSTYTDTAGHAVLPSDSDAAHYFGAHPGVSIVKRTNGEDANAAPGPTILAGGPVQWTYIISNTGNVPIADISVTDDNGTPFTEADDFTAACESTNLGPGDEQTCSATAQAVIGPYANNAEVFVQPKIGSTPIGPSITDSDLSHYFGANISYTLEKTTNHESADNTVPGPFIEIGQPVTWAFTVTNTGNIALTDVEVFDNNGTPSITGDDPLVCTISVIEPGQSNPLDSCILDGIAQAGQYANIGRAKVEMLNKDFVEYDHGHYYGYDPDQLLDMTVTLNSHPTGSPPGIFIPVGGDIQLLYTVYNSSPSQMTINGVTDDSGTPGVSSDDAIFCQNVVLASFLTHVCPGPITQALSGQHTHTGHVSASVGLTLLEHDASSSYFGVQGGITLDVHTNGQDPAAALDLPINVGDPVVWEYFIENTSNVPLSLIHLVDPPDTTITCPESALAISSAMTCTRNGTAQPGVFQNDAHVKGDWPDGLQTSSADAFSTYYGVQGGISLEFKVNGSSADESPGQDWFIGDVAELTYELTNTGNYLMNNITVTDSVNNMISCPATTLAAGASLNCTAQELVAAGLQARIATVNGTVNGKPLTANDRIYYTGVPRYYDVFLPLIRR